MASKIHSIKNSDYIVKNKAFIVKNLTNIWAASNKVIKQLLQQLKM